MPPVGAAVAGLLGGGGFTILGSALLGGLAKAAAGAGLSYVANALAGKPEEGALRKNRPVGMEVTLRAGDVVPRFFIVGTWATAGQLVFVRSYGDGDKTPNAFLVQVIVLSHLPVDNIGKIFVDGSPVSYTPGAAQSGRGQAIPEYRKDGKDHLWIRFYNGSQTVADDYLTSTFPSGPKAWGTNQIGRGCAYAIVTARVNPKLFRQAPEIKFQVRGLPLYDVTKDSSAGGSGTQRWDQPATWAFTRNPAVILYNLFRGIRHNGQWVYGLQTVSAAQLPFSSWAAAINECDLPVTNADASSDPQFRAGGEISFATEPGEELEEFLKACNGRIADAGGIYKIKVGAAGAAILSFTDDALMLTDEHTFTPFPSLNDTVNGISATYISPEEGWIEKAAPPRIDEGYIAADGGRRSIADVAYRRVSDKRQVQRLMKAALLEERRFRRHVVVLPPETFAIEGLDFVGWTSARNGYTAKLWRVDGIIDRSNLDQVMTLTEVDPADYGWSAGSDEVATVDGPIDLETVPVQPMAGFSAAPVTISGAGGRALPGIRVAWDATAIDDVDQVQFEVWNSGGTAVIARDETSFPEAGAYDISKSLNGATSYLVRARFNTTSGHRDFAWSASIAVTTPDTRVPAALIDASLLALVNQGTASGKVLTQQVLPAPAGFQTLYQITIYGTGPNPPAAGAYYFVDADGKPGILMDSASFRVGSLAANDFPFEVVGGKVKIKSAVVGDIDAGRITVGVIDAARIKGGSLSETFSKSANGTFTNQWVPGTEIKIRSPGGGTVLLYATFSYKQEKKQTATFAIMRGKNSTNFKELLNGTVEFAPPPDTIKKGRTMLSAVDFPDDPGGDNFYSYAVAHNGKGSNVQSPRLVAVWIKK
jgi:hypothetical protein